MKENVNITDIFMTCDIITPLKNNNQLILVSNPLQKTYIPLFTSQEQYELWNLNHETIPMTLPQIVQILQTNQDIDGIVINPFDQNMLFEKEEILQTFQKDIPFTKNEAVRIQEVTNNPALIQHLQDIFENDDNIIQAYLIQMTREINNETSYLILLDAVEFSQDVCQQIAHQTFDYISEDDKIDFISIETDFAQKAIQQIQPIYTKIMN